MLFFGPISSLFDFLTFWVMLHVFHAGPALFRSGWFVESLATQTLVIFAIRTRRVPFLRSRPSRPLLMAAVGVVAVGVALPFSPLAAVLGFQRLPIAFFAALAGMVVTYLVLIERRETGGSSATWPTGRPGHGNAAAPIASSAAPAGSSTTVH